MRQRDGGISRLLPRTIQGRIFLLLAVVILPVVLLQVAAYYRSYQAQSAAELRSDLEVARSIATTFDAYRQDVLHQELAIGLTFTGAARLLPDAERQQYLISNLEAYPTIGEFLWISPQGQILASSRSGVVGQDVGQRSYYRAILAGRDWAVTDLAVDPLAGAPVFFIASAIRSGAGGLLGIVAASIDPERLASVFPAVRLGQGFFTIADSAGRLVYRSPATDMTWEERNLSDDPMIRRALAGEESSGTFTSGTEAMERMGAVTPIGSVGWAVRAGRPAAAVKAALLQGLGRSFALFVLVFLGAIGLAVVVGRQIAVPMGRVREYAASLGLGEIAPPPDIAGPSEAHELTITLGKMAEQLRKREELLCAKVDTLAQANRALQESENRYRQEVAENQRLIGVLGQQVAALDGTNAALQRAQRRLLTEREAERKALSRELHDEVIQELLSLRYQMQEVTGDPGHRRDGLNDVNDNIRDLIDDVRHICSDLRPPTIDSLGLGAAIQSYTYDWSARAGVAVHLDIDSQVGRLPEALELSIFRIMQEALNNVRKHAHARTVYISLKRTSPGVLLVSIADDGCGMPSDYDLAGLAATGHYGLVGIHERAELLRGGVHVETQPGAGVLVEVEIPHPEVAAA